MELYIREIVRRLIRRDLEGIFLGNPKQSCQEWSQPMRIHVNDLTRKIHLPSQLLLSQERVRRLGRREETEGQFKSSVYCLKW